MTKRYWKVCERCGSREVTSDCLARWCDEAQEWEVSSHLDFKNCESDECMGDETELESLEIIPDCVIPEAIRKLGWFLNECEDGTFAVKNFHGDPDATGPFSQLADAHLWARANQEKADA